MLIYDNGGEILDRYTVIPWPDSDDPVTRSMFLGCDRGGLGYSEWGELTEPPSDYLGTEIPFGDLDEATQKHIIRRTE